MLGHELGHTVDILGDPRRAQMVSEMVEGTNDLLLKRAATNQMAWRLAERDQLLPQLEARAEAAEKVIWQELRRASAAR